MLSVVSSSALIEDIYDEVDIVTASFSGYREVAVVARNGINVLVTSTGVKRSWEIGCEVEGPKKDDI